MSKNLKAILKKNRAQKKRGNSIVADDAMVTGTEPEWEGWDSWELKKFFREQARAFNFYNYYTNGKKLKKDCIQWMKSEGYSKNDIKTIQTAPDNVPGQTVGGICRCLNRGMPTIHPNAQDWHDDHVGLGDSPRPYDEFVRESIATALGSNRVYVEVKKKEAKKRPSVRDRIEAKCNETIMQDLEILLDDWILTKKGKVTAIDMYKKMTEYEIPVNCVNLPRLWIEKQLNELLGAYDKTDPDFVEGYSNLTRPQLKDRIQKFEGMLADLDKYKNAKKATRKTRVKKEKPAAKQVERMKYCEKDDDLKLISQHPVKLIGATKVILFNRKYRDMYILESTSGFGVKGTTITNVDLEKSELKKLRIPEEFIPIAQNKTERQIKTVWNKLTTKAKTPNSTRVNDNTIIIRVF